MQYEGLGEPCGSPPRFGRGLALWPPKRRYQERASGGSRTHNPRITNAVLCRLKLRWHSFRPGAALIRYLRWRPSARNQVSLWLAAKSVKSRSSLDLRQKQERSQKPKKQ